MAYFKLDPAFLDEHRDVRWIQDSRARDDKRKFVFVQEVLPVIVYHRDNEYKDLKRLIKSHAWLRPLIAEPKPLPFFPGNSTGFENTHHLNSDEISSVDEIVEHLLTDPLTDTLILADFVRLYRCKLLNEFLRKEEPSYYAFGRAYSHTSDIRDLWRSFRKDIKNSLVELRKNISEPESDIDRTSQVLYDGKEHFVSENPLLKWEFEVSFSKAAGLRTVGFGAGYERFDDFALKLNDASQQDSQLQAAAWIAIICFDLREGEEREFEKVIWHSYNHFSRHNSWEVHKNQIREICLKSGSPIPHDEPLENVAELRRHLAHRNDYYKTIAKLNKDLDIQQRIITNLSFRHLLESLPGPKKDSKQDDKSHWDRFWGQAFQIAEFEKGRLEDETNEQFEEAWRMKRIELKKIKEAAAEAPKEAAAGAQRPRKGGFPEGTEERTGRWKVDEEEPGEEVKVDDQIGEIPAVGTRTAESKNDKELLGAEKPVKKLAEKKEKGQKAAQNEARRKEIEAQKAELDIAEKKRLDSIRIKSPLVAVLQQFHRGDVVYNEGFALYSKLSENIHRHRQRPYDINESQWDALPYCLLDAMRPTHSRKDNGNDDWTAEKKRYVIDKFQ